MAWGVSAFAKWQERKKVAGESIQIPTEELFGKMEKFGEDVLGKAIKAAPGKEVPKIKTEIRVDKIVEQQVKEVTESLKQLPEEALKKLKKEILKDFCREVMKE